MKRILIFVLLTAFVSCQKKDVGPADLLYNRWQLVQVQEANKGPKVPAKPTFISFGIDGKIVYDEGGNDGACCVPRRFSRNGQTLVLDSSTDQPEYCKYADILCTSPYSSVSDWIIQQVDGQQLVLQVNNSVLTHRRAN